MQIGKDDRDSLFVFGRCDDLSVVLSVLSVVMAQLVYCAVRGDDSNNVMTNSWECLRLYIVLFVVMTQSL